MLEPFLAKSRFTNHGQRVVEGQRLLQSARDITLGWIYGPGADAVERDFYLRQLWDAKGLAEIETMTARGRSATTATPKAAKTSTEIAVRASSSRDAPMNRMPASAPLCLA